MQNMKAVNQLMLSGCILLLLSCSNKLSVEDYIEKVTSLENGYYKRKEVGPYKVEIQYTPVEYLAIKKEKGKPTEATLTKMQTDLAKTVQLNFRLGVKDQTTDLLEFGIRNMKEYEARMKYFSFEFQNDIYLEQEGKKIPCTMFHFERIYKLKSNRSFTIGFDEVNPNEPFKVVIDADVLKTGPFKIDFSERKQYSLSI